MRYWEDIKEGEVVELGRRTMDKERMIAFAREFDPQPFHTDEKAADAQFANLAGSTDVGLGMAFSAALGVVDRAQSLGDVISLAEGN